MPASRFDAELGAEVAPFGALLLRSESTSSSQIENLTSGARAIALAELEQESRLERAGEVGGAIQIVANVRAMQAAIPLADRLDLEAILAMHAALMERAHGHEPGRWRQDQVWIGGTSFGPHLAEYIPPHHEHVVDAMTDLVAFIRRDDIPTLAHAALAHAQFETIHPFTDGPGVVQLDQQVRLGRGADPQVLRSEHDDVL